jgi:hypothetical protein
MGVSGGFAPQYLRYRRVRTPMMRRHAQLFEADLMRFRAIALI